MARACIVAQGVGEGCVCSDMSAGGGVRRRRSDVNHWNMNLYRQRLTGENGLVQIALELQEEAQEAADVCAGSWRCRRRGGGCVT